MPTLVHTESSKAWGGQEIRVCMELAGLPPLGWQVGLWAPPDSEIFRRARNAGMRCDAVSFDGIGDLDSILRLRRLIGQGRPRVIVTHSSIDSWLVGFSTRGMAARPVIVRTRHLSTPVKNFLSYRWFPDAICTTSESIRAQLTTAGLDPERIVSIPTGVDPQRFRPVQNSLEEKRALRGKWGLPTDRPLVGGVFVVRTWKGIFDFVKIAAAVPEADFVVAGTGPSLWSMERDARDLGVTDRLHFLGHVEAVEEVYRSLDVFLMPSTGHEGVPQSLLQAMATALPIVASRLPSIEEALPHGLLVSAGDIHGFAAAIRSFLSDPSQAARLGDIGRARTMERYTQVSALGRIDEFYRSLIGK